MKFKVLYDVIEDNTVIAANQEIECINLVHANAIFRALDLYKCTYEDIRFDPIAIGFVPDP